MKRLLAGCLIGSLATAGGAAVLYSGCPGCIERDRVNATCEWREDPVFRLDLSTSSDREHLSHDAQLAEELAIRYADAEYGRRSGYEGHGGLIDNGAFRGRCMATLAALIERNHGVTSDEVRVARGRRNVLFDIGVAVLFVPVYCLVAAGLSVALRRRFSLDQPSIVIVFTGLASLAGSFIGLQLFALWGAIWETVRVGNGHISTFRAATWTRWTENHHAIEFIAGVLLFCLVSALVSGVNRFAEDLPADELSSESA